MAGKVGGTKGGPVSDPNVLPFIDILLVLLIIFMVTAPIPTVDIRVDLPPFPVRSGYAGEVAARFEQAYLAKYGYRQPGAVVEAVDWYIVASVASASAGAHRARSWRNEGSGPFRRGTRKAYFPDAGGYVECAVIDRRALPVGETIEGPAIIEEAEATTLLLPRSTASVSPRGHLVITLEG